MAFFNSLLSTLGYQRPSEFENVPPEISSSRKHAEIPLPPELIGHIASFLSPESAASFAICCRSTYSTISSQSFKVLREKKLDRYKFLTLLERQLPNYTLCYYCAKLHAIDSAHRYLKLSDSSKDHLPCWESDLELGTGYFVHSDFSFAVFQMTMKHYRLGQDCSELLNLLSKKPTTYLHYGYIERHTVLAKIIAGSMVLQEQRVFMLPPDRALAIPWDLLVAICPHSRPLSASSFDDRGSIVISRITQGVLPKRHRSGIIQCRHCLTEFKVNYKSFGERGNAMFFTRWLDLGQGQSATDQNWRGHVRGIEFRRLSIAEWPLIPSHRGSVSAAFENQESLAFDFDPSLSSQDDEELFRKSPYSWPSNV